MQRGQVDLRQCEEGDILISALGATLRYVGLSKRSTKKDYPHEVEYLYSPYGKFRGLGNGDRTDDGYVFRKNRIPETDHDIVMVIKKKDAEYAAITFK